VTVAIDADQHAQAGSGGGQRAGTATIVDGDDDDEEDDEDDFDSGSSGGSAALGEAPASGASAMQPHAAAVERMQGVANGRGIVDVTGAVPDSSAGHGVDGASGVGSSGGAPVGRGDGGGGSRGGGSDDGSDKLCGDGVGPVPLMRWLWAELAWHSQTDSGGAARQRRGLTPVAHAGAGAANAKGRRKRDRDEDVDGVSSFGWGAARCCIARCSPALSCVVSCDADAATDVHPVEDLATSQLVIADVSDLLLKLSCGMSGDQLAGSLSDDDIATVVRNLVPVKGPEKQAGLSIAAAFAVLRRGVTGKDNLTVCMSRMLAQSVVIAQRVADACLRQLPNVCPEPPLYLVPHQSASFFALLTAALMQIAASQAVCVPSTPKQPAVAMGQQLALYASTAISALQQCLVSLMDLCAQKRARLAPCLQAVVDDGVAAPPVDEFEACASVPFEDLSATLPLREAAEGCVAALCAATKVSMGFGSEQCVGLMEVRCAPRLVQWRCARGDRCIRVHTCAVVLQVLLNVMFEARTPLLLNPPARRQAGDAVVAALQAVRSPAQTLDVMHRVQQLLLRLRWTPCGGRLQDVPSVEQIFRECVPMLEPVRGVGTFSWASSAKSWTGYTGLTNQGATCYMNSVLQQLYMIPAIRKGVRARWCGVHSLTLRGV
jgi:hypothetical protein